MPRFADYAFMHRGRQLRLGPIAFWIVVGTLIIMAIWTVATATYFAFRDDVLTRLIARQAEMQFGYEDRIAELRAQVDRMSSRQLLDQEQFEQKLDQLVRRQTTLESRASALNSFPDPSRPRSGASRPVPAASSPRR
jgi:TolA-binding protein